MPQLPHGGDLAEARRHAPDVTDWLDLSTGVNPHPYPAAVTAAMTADALHRLPQADAMERLLAAARRAYGVPPQADIVAAPGTEAIIRWLPRLVPARRVAIVGPTYGTHAAAWSETATVAIVPSLDPTADLTVLVNPNNPDGRVMPPRALAAFAARSPCRPTLVVDEAYGDLVPGLSVAGTPGILVLRSFGKFYGLPGLRLGFLIGAPAHVAPLREALGAWAVSGPALVVGAEALADAAWAGVMRCRLAAERAELDAVLADAGLTVVGGTDLFRLVAHPHAARLQSALASHGIWTRAFHGMPHRLRIGLPGDGLSRLAAALTAVRASLASA